MSGATAFAEWTLGRPERIGGCEGAPLDSQPSKGFERKVVAALREGDDAAETVRELEAVRAWADQLLRRLKPEG